MEIYQAVALGIIQGLTEFLPVSSSGHLVLGQHFFGIREPELLFNVSLHVGTLAAVLLVFYREIGSILAALGRLVSALFDKKADRELFRQDSDLKLALLIVAGSIPTAVLGLLFHQMADRLFSSIVLVGCMLLLTGTFLWTTRRMRNQAVASSDFTLKNGILIGVVQGLAVIPGISRSGSTIIAGLFLGLNREMAARYSFLLSIPAIVGAEGLAFKLYAGRGIHLDLPMLTGTLAAFVVGYGALIVLLRIVKQGRLHLFAPYCWVLGVIAIIVGI